MNKNNLFLIVFICGACSLIVEIAGGRIISPYIGNTIYTWAAVIALVLGALSLGYYLGGRYADKFADEKHFATIISLAGLFTLLLPVYGNPIAAITVFFPLPIASLISSLILVPSSIFYGMISPYAIKLSFNENEKGTEGKTTGNIFALSTLGSIIGALSAGFLLIPNLPITYIFILCGLIVLLCSLLANRNAKINYFGILIVLILIIFVSQISTLNLYNGQVVYATDSTYSHISVLNMDYNGAQSNILVLDNAFSSGENLLGEPVFNYSLTTRLAYKLVKNDSSSGLLIGVGAGTMIEELKHFFPQMIVDGIEIDEKTIQLGKQYFSLKEDNHTNIIIDDGRKYLRSTDKTYDIVLIDAYRGYSIPYHLSTQEFFATVKKRLNKNGVMAINVISSLKGPKSKVFLYFYNTISTSFDHVIVIPTKQSESENQNLLIIATDQDVGEFKNQHNGLIYDKEIPKLTPLTDELNPIESFVYRD